MIGELRDMRARLDRLEAALQRPTQEIRDDDGQLRLRWGRQPDGAWTARALDAGGAVVGDLVQACAARVTRASAQSLAHNTTTVVSWESAQFDTDSLWAAGTPGRLTFPRAGLWAVIGNLRYGNNGTGQRMARLRLNGSTSAASCWVAAVASAEVQVAAHLNVAAGDFVELLAFQNSGGALGLDVSGTGPPFLSAAWLGAL